MIAKTLEIKEEHKVLSKKGKPLGVLQAHLHQDKERPESSL